MSIVIQVSVSEAALLNRPVTGSPDAWGGSQRLLVALQKQLTIEATGEWFLPMTEKQARQVVRYAHEKYGSGGYQERIRPIAPRVAAILSGKIPRQLDLF